MSKSIAAIPSEELPHPLPLSEKAPIDLLNRQKIVDQMLHLLGILSEARGSCTFALNGQWGSGKTFVLNMLERQLRKYQDGEKYIVFHYNCWEYDYYDEPLIAIVAAMLDSLDKETSLVPENVSNAFIRGIHAAKPIIEKLAQDLIKSKLGTDLSELFSLAKEGIDATKESAKENQEKHNYNQYYAFNKTMDTAKEDLKKLAAVKTIVIVVDELDRCLPSYAIKVLERLHHLFYGLENTVVALAVDKTQLENTVVQIFGSKTNATQYLKKFINFEFTLDTGTICGSFKEKYADYVSLFDETLIETDFSVDDYFSALFAGIEIRTQERLIERITTIHKMLFPEEKKDYSFMCFELMWLVFTQYHKLSANMPITYSDRGFSIQSGVCPSFSKYMQSEWRGINMNRSHSLPRDNVVTYSFPTPIDIPQLLMWYLWQMYPNSPTQYLLSNNSPRLSEYRQNLSGLMRVDAMLSIIG